MSHLINRRDLDFLLHEWLDVATLCERPRFAGHDRETFDAVVEAAHTLAVEQFAAHAAKLDANEPTFDGERVNIIPEVKAALDAYVDGGFMGAAFDEADGGLQLPYTISQSVAALFTAANIGTAGYPFLTGAAANLLRVVGSPEQQTRYMQPMIAGRFFGTMCLSEPQAGSSLGDIRTRAIPNEDGTYRLRGNKMWISGGEHDLSENIVHLVLARIEGAPAGTKGISLFIVPKYRVNDDGSLGERNGVRLAGINHKMGYRGTVNTVLNFGDEDDCFGEIVGEPNTGLAGMFHMMNEARISVGMGASVLGYSGYLHALDYARERPQGRHPGSKPTDTPVPIIEHADVRRMLLAQKAYVEGGLALCLYCATLVDQQETAEDETERNRLGLLLDILTPIAKAWPSEYGLEANKLAIQVLGGYGYTREYPVERLYRDNRLNPIHEGTNGIQALDLLGRKVTMRDGAALSLLLREIGATAEDAAEFDELHEYARSLAEAIDTVADTTQALRQQATDAESYLANANEYLEMLGHVVIAWTWLRQALVAVRAKPAGDADRDFYWGKLQATRYFFRWELPTIDHRAHLLAAVDDTCLGMWPDWF
ncbi:acyl-CoA dehydrogenase [Spectribacter hydrogenoxidans]|uniref:Acyl-CoA dehydrogenase n=1 Tax=Spectribacter hydrogenoxidans TaxID=3075608 RepID=A0ABU3BWS8_9GAMM|nr:acyl-CoA dehydrogenase [Salinisphaera sp. W335]MDT0633750.1 acyl-CoA dehydrogenase [Salinisphaera sp. W335]